MAKLKPTLNLVSHATTSSSIVQSPIASKSPGTQGTLSTRLEEGRETCGERAKSKRRSVEFSRVRGNSQRLETQTLTTTAQCGHNLRFPTAYVSHFDKVLPNVRQENDSTPRHQMEDLDVNSSIWNMFMSVTLQAAVHLGNDYGDIFNQKSISPSEH